VIVGFDGGVTPGEVGALAALGADLVVTGTAVFSDERPPAEVIAAMHGQLA
jgi:pentose-5-phosphate-3-epimerase